MSGISELDGELQRLDQGDWAGDKITPLVFIKRPHYHRSIYDVTTSDVWTQVMGQLRQGIRLKKVDYSRTPAEYELTPYEVYPTTFWLNEFSTEYFSTQMLMDDVRTRKYRLSPVSKVEIKSVQARKDARDIILDFIRLENI